MSGHLTWACCSKWGGELWVDSTGQVQTRPLVQSPRRLTLRVPAGLGWGAVVHTQARQAEGLPSSAVCTFRLSYKTVE